jgi:anti-anti-sigma regulatory factor
MSYTSNLILNQEKKAVILEIRGFFLDMADTAPSIDAKTVQGKNAIRFVANISQAQPFTSRGIRCLVHLKEEAEALGLKFHVLCANPEIRTLLTDLSLHGIFSIIGDLRELKATP